MKEDAQNHAVVSLRETQGDVSSDYRKHNLDRVHSTSDRLTPVEIAEEHRSRSHYMRRLIQETDSCLRQDVDLLPPVLVQFWDDAKAVPDDVSECLNTWQLLDAQGFERVLFDDDSAERFISEHYGPRHLAAFERCIHPAMRSDYFRLCFIMRRGGIYVDADDAYEGGDLSFLLRDGRLKLQPLCYEISSDSMADPTDYSAKHPDSPDLIFYVNNNPIIAPPRHPLILMALERSTEILLADGVAATDVQSTTGPGNLTACLVRHAIESELAGVDRDFVLLPSWNSMAVSRWPLEYRSDKRNWRLWDGRSFPS